MRVHFLVSMWRTLISLESVIGQWEHSIPYKLHIRLSYFLWDVLFGLEAEHLTPLAFSPLSLTLAWDLEEETHKTCEELWQNRNLLKIWKENLWIYAGNSASWAQVSDFKFIYYGWPLPHIVLSLLVIDNHYCLLVCLWVYHCSMIWLTVPTAWSNVPWLNKPYLSLNIGLTYSKWHWLFTHMTWDAMAHGHIPCAKFPTWL